MKEFVLLENQNDFDLKQIADSGQCFRMEKIHADTSSTVYSNIASGKYVEIEQKANNFKFYCSEDEFENMWKPYFDLNVDYGEYKKMIKNDKFLDEALEVGGGIRMLHQPLWETLVTFILSANNNIPRIKKGVEGISELHGKKLITNRQYDLKQEAYSFPTPKELEKCTLKDLRDCGFGYRDNYVMELINNTLDTDCKNLNNIEKAKTYDEAMVELLKIKGVGKKVANCVALFGLHKLDAYPVDTWMKAMIDDVYKGNFDTQPYKGFEGYIQQLQFYGYRIKSGK